MQIMVMDDRHGNIILWPNGGWLPTHKEIDEVINLFQRLKSDNTPEEIEANHQQIDYECRHPEVRRDYKKNQEPESERIKPSGYIYILQVGDYCKIGRTKMPESRLKRYLTENPFPVETKLLVEIKDYCKVEESLLELFSGNRFRNEWFNLSEENIEQAKEFLLENGGVLINY